MRKGLATIRALIKGDASINYVEKIPITKAPGETTMDVGNHQ
jgi:hypothetical protein